MYSVKEIFYTLQGEGANAGTPAVFCRFAGCNLWSGREEDRASAVCRFCDTEFVGTDGTGGGRFSTPEELVKAIKEAIPGETPAPRLVVCTGGEPLLQLDAPLVDALHRAGFRIAIETNGTQRAPEGIDWICVSPKAGAPLVLERGDEIKLVYPQAGAEPPKFEALPFKHFFLQPMDGPDRTRNTRLAVEYCLAHPRWRLSLQTHKLIGIPQAMELSYRFAFDAAHRFGSFPAGHPYHGVHGHSFQVEVAVGGTPDEKSGFIVDFGDIEKACAEVRSALDHRMLNEVKGLATPSLENLSVWIWRQLIKQLPGLARVTVRRDSIGQSCTYTGGRP